MNRAKRRMATAVARSGDWGEWRDDPKALRPLTEAEIAEKARHFGMPLADYQAQMAASRGPDRLVYNNIYTVAIRSVGGDDITLPKLIHLSIKRTDQKPIGVERFRDFQRIKNDLVGPECEGAEIYPAESRLVDTSNQYHIWCLANPKNRFSFGYGDRLVTEASGAGAIQQRFR